MLITLSLFGLAVGFAYLLGKGLREYRAAVAWDVWMREQQRQESAQGWTDAPNWNLEHKASYQKPKDAA